MTRRAYLLVALGYAILAVGAIVAFYMINDSQNKIDDQQTTLTRVNEELIKVAAAYCAAIIQPDAREKEVLDTLSKSNHFPTRLDPTCRRIVIRLERAKD